MFDWLTSLFGKSSEEEKPVEGGTEETPKEDTQVEEDADEEQVKDRLKSLGYL